MRHSKSILVFALALACWSIPAPATEKGPRSGLALVRDGDKVLGFDLVVNGKPVAPVRFSSNGLIFGADFNRHILGNAAIRLRAKDGIGLKLSGGIRLPRPALVPGDFPEICFWLRIDEFDAAQWEKAVGRVPFHFLTMSMPGAEVVHQRGWLNATPKADPFPFLGDIHAGTPEICSNWSHNWSYVVPIGAYPIPATGLWAPAEKLYVGYDFMGSRLAEQTERYLATAYCAGHRGEGQFIALAYPYARRGFQTLTYPKKGDTIEGRFRLVYSLDMPSTEDPNAFLQQDYFHRYAAQLPAAPAMNDMGWMPGGTWLPHLPAASRGGLIVRLAEGNAYEEPGTVEIDGWTAHRESAVNAAFRCGDRQLIERLHREIAYLKTKAQRVTVEGDECLFWPKPLEGKWREKFGGEAVKTLHNANGWAAGIALVDLYRHEKNAEYLPLIDGVYNWTKHFVWTRNEFADVPSSPFAIGGTLSAAFLLDYYYTFCDDPQRAARAGQAVELARKITYRYMVAWASDNDRDDNLDSSFLWEPNSGRDWTGTACANEVHWNLDTLVQVYVNCGDPILHHYLRGALERWHLLYKDIPQDSLADYDHQALSEWLGLFDGTMAGRGGRAGFGTADILPLCYPVGRSALRVTCGRKAAFACCKNGVHWRVENYRYAPGVNFVFDVRSSKGEPFDVTLSFPFADLADRPLSLTRGGKIRTLAAGLDLVRSPDAPSYVYIRGLRDGDTITVGQLGTGPETTCGAGVPPVLAAETAAPQDRAGATASLPSSALGARVDKPPVAPEAVRPFREIQLPLNERLPCDWNDVGSFAGLWPGRHWAWRVPFYLAPAPDSTGPLGTSRQCKVRINYPPPGVYIVFAPKCDGGTVKLRYAGAAKIDIKTGQCAIGWGSWPPCFHRKVLACRIPPTSIPAELKGGDLTIAPENAYLLAVTQFVDYQESSVAEVFRRGQADCQAVMAEEAKMAHFRAEMSRVPASRIAILPSKDLIGPVVKFMYATGLMKKCRRLTVEELLDAKLFNAKNFPVVLNVDGENYAGTIHHDGDGAAAIVNYLRSGGFLAMLTSQPLPFCYDGLGAVHKPHNLTRKLGLPIASLFEKPPAGAALRISFLPGQDWLTGYPKSMAFFSEGDLRLRSVLPGTISSDATYTSIATVMGDDGRSYGDIAAMASYRSGPLRGAGLLFVWSRLLEDPQLGPRVIEDVIRKIVTRVE
jgi:hypothetical protein